MPLRRVSAIRFWLAVTAVICAGAFSRGDVVVYRGTDPNQNVNQSLERYSDTGTDLGPFASFLSESLDSLYGAPNGDVYAFGNNLGRMTIIRYASSGQKLAETEGATPNTFESAAIVVRGQTLLTASASPVPGSDYLPGGIYSINAQTLTVNGALLTTPAQSTLNYLSFALSPAGDVLYAWASPDNGQGGILAFSVGRNSINGTPLFTIPDHGKLAVSADGSRLVVGYTTGINWYNTNPADLTVHSLIAPGVAGITAFMDYTFAPDGNLLVTAKTANGPGLFLFNGDTGAFISHLTDFSSSTPFAGAEMAYVVPECSFATIAPLLSLFLLTARSRRVA